MEEGRSLAETPTWSVATVTTIMVFVCFLVERSICRLGKWLRKTKRKAMLASLEKIREGGGDTYELICNTDQIAESSSREQRKLMLLGLISLMLSQTARWISEICVPSSLFTDRFFICSESDFPDGSEVDDEGESHPLNGTDFASTLFGFHPHGCAEGYEPFVSFEGLEQLHRFLFILGITHVLYSFITVVLSMIKIYSWRKWESQAYPMSTEDLQARRNKMMVKQSSFVFHRASHPWSKSKILIWMLCFIRQFKGSIAKSDYMALRLGFITNHKLPISYNFHKYMVRSMEDEFHGSIGISWSLWGYAILCIFFTSIPSHTWLSFVPVILIMLVGTKLQHVVAQLALEVVEATDLFVGSQIKPRDELFWFGKPEILLWLIQFISFQNAFEMATFIWSLWELKAHSCFMKNHYMVAVRLISGVLVQFWCSYSTLPLNVIITQMGSKFKKTLIAESVRDSLHSWCKRVKNRRGPLLSRAGTTTSICSLDTMDDDTMTVGTLSRSPSFGDLNEVTLDEQAAYNISRL